MPSKQQVLDKERKERTAPQCVYPAQVSISLIPRASPVPNAAASCPPDLTHADDTNGLLPFSPSPPTRLSLGELPGQPRAPGLLSPLNPEFKPYLPLGFHRVPKPFPPSSCIYIKLPNVALGVQQDPAPTALHHEASLQQALLPGPRSHSLLP